MISSHRVVGHTADSVTITTDNKPSYRITYLLTSDRQTYIQMIYTLDRYIVDLSCWS